MREGDEETGGRGDGGGRARKSEEKAGAREAGKKEHQEKHVAVYKIFVGDCFFFFFIRTVLRGRFSEKYFNKARHPTTPEVLSSAPCVTRYLRKK